MNKGYTQSNIEKRKMVAVKMNAGKSPISHGERYLQNGKNSGKGGGMGYKENGRGSTRAGGEKVNMADTKGSFSSNYKMGAKS